MENPMYRNPDSDFVLHGVKEHMREKEDTFLTNSQKTISTKNLETNKLHQSSDSVKSYLRKAQTPSINELERSIRDLKSELHDLNASLQENYDKSEIFLRSDERDYDEETMLRNDDEEDEELTHLLQREDAEAVSHVPDDDPSWFQNPRHKTKPIGDYPTYHKLGVSRRSVSPVNRSAGRLGSEIMTKDVTGVLKPSDLASNDRTFPIRLSAPHIVGIKSLLPPKHTVRPQNRERTKSPQARSRSIDPDMFLSASLKKMLNKKKSRSRHRSPSPLPVWMPTSKAPNASSLTPPPFRKQRGRSASKGRPGTAPGGRGKMNPQLSQSLPLSIRPFRPAKYERPTVQPLPSATELTFLRSADEVDTRRALVENSPYQQELARLRLERLRVEEEYLLQLKRESELERIRGPKPKWYTLKGPEFHYECNKNTALHRNADQWSETLQYRDQLLETSREFASNMRSPVATLE